MKKFEGILFCTDLDGTLLKRDKTISRENKDAIEYFKAEGGRFTFVTGRMPYYVRDMYDAVSPNAPIGAANGGGVYDFEKEEYLWTHPISEEVFEIVDSVDRTFPALGIQAQTFERCVFVKDSEAMEWFRKITGLPFISEPIRSIPEPISKILFASVDLEEMESLKAHLHSHALSGRFDFIRSEKWLYEITPKGVNKGTLLKKITEILGLSMEKTIAIGDYNNDISMIKAAGLGVAVANACDEAKAAADLVTVSNEESAVAKIIDLLDKKA